MECYNIGKKFHNRWVLRAVSFKLSDGRSLLIAGPSGSGKSILINIISGILDPTEGRVILCGYKSGSDYARDKQILSCVWSENSLFGNMSIVNNLRFFSLINGQDWKQVNTKMMHLMQKLGIYYEKTKFISNLSSGTQRKADLCRSLINNSDLFIFDEPTAMLDNKSKKAFIKILLEYKKKGKSIIIVSHHASLYTELIDDIIILKNGRIVYHNTIEELTCETQELKDSFILKTSDRIKANQILLRLPEVKNTYVSQKSIHVYLKKGGNLSSVINAISAENFKLKEIISKKQNLDKYIGDIINVH